MNVRIATETARKVTLIEGGVAEKWIRLFSDLAALLDSETLSTFFFLVEALPTKKIESSASGQ